MFFKHVMIGFLILGVLGWMFGDHIFYFQGNLMMRWQYSMPAYEAYERIVRHYPNSRYIKEARQLMTVLRERSSALNKTLERKEKELRKIQEDRQKKESFH